MWLLLVLAGVAAYGVFVLVRGLRAAPLAVAGKHVLVTGGSEGLGLAFAQLVASRGAHVTVVARSGDKLAAAKRAIEASRASPSTQKVHTATADVADAPALAAAVASAAAALGAVDVLVANAGLARPRLVADQTDDEVQRMLSVNLVGCVNAVRAVLPAMRARRSGRIVFVASGMSLTAFAGYAAYCATKWGVRGYAEALATELEPERIATHIYYAPTMDTPGLVAENQIKPAATTQLEAIGSAISAKDAAASLLQGLGTGRFAIAGDAGLEVLAMCSLASPQANLALCVVAAPLLVLLGAAWRAFIAYVCRKHAAKKTE